MHKIIIAGFPGIGKSMAAKNNPTNILDLESSDFHWILDAFGNKVQHPAWPINYVQAIRCLAEDADDCPDYKDIMYICISTHKEVLNTLLNDGELFVIFAPSSKENSIEKYVKRGNTKSFIDSMDKNWDNYMEDIKSYNMPVYYTDEYLGDLLRNDIIYSTIMNDLEIVQYMRV